jgi:hypothetical protein
MLELVAPALPYASVAAVALIGFLWWGLGR